MWGWYFFSFGISSKKNWDEPVHHKQLVSSVWKLMPNPVESERNEFLFFCPGVTSLSKWATMDYLSNKRTLCAYLFQRKILCQYLANLLSTPLNYIDLLLKYPRNKNQMKKKIRKVKTKSLHCFCQIGYCANS